VPGVIRTRVGYCGGTTKNPDYQHVGDHSETIQIDYDPSKISYRKLVEMFWSNHSVCGKPYSRQYQSIIFYHNDEQKKIAVETRDAEQAKQKDKIVTEINPLGQFTLAEDYHQKYELRQHREFLAAMTAVYPKDADLVNSTVAARLNSYVSGNGSAEVLKKEIDSYGLSKELKEKLLEMVKGK
jgi:peptide-methionine (S)-S-oxide reductase